MTTIKQVPWVHAQSIKLVADAVLVEAGDPQNAAASALSWPNNHQAIDSLAEEIQRVG